MKKTFQSELAVGHKFEDQVKARLRLEGVQIQDGPSGRGGTPDFFANGRAIEVKSSRRKFTGAHENYPYATCTVDAVKCWDAKSPKPHAYVFICQSTGAMIWTPGWHRDSWTVCEQKDRVHNTTKACYCAPNHLLLPIERLITALK